MKSREVEAKAFFTSHFMIIGAFKKYIRRGDKGRGGGGGGGGLKSKRKRTGGGGSRLNFSFSVFL